MPPPVEIARTHPPRWPRPTPVREHPPHTPDDPQARTPLIPLERSRPEVTSGRQ